MCSFVTLGHSGLGWAHSWQGSSKRRKTCGRFCTILIGTLSALKLRSKRGLYAAALSVKVAPVCNQDKVATRRPAKSSGLGSGVPETEDRPRSIIDEAQSQWSQSDHGLDPQCQLKGGVVHLRYKDTKIQTAYVGSFIVTILIYHAASEKMKLVFLRTGDCCCCITGVD